MPTYDYVCDACEHAFELFQQMTAPVKRKCPECGKLKLRRLIGTGAGVLFKGSGFYETDYRSDSYKAAAKEAEKKPDTAEKKPGKTSDGAKPAAKSSESKPAPKAADAKPAKKKSDG